MRFPSFVILNGTECSEDELLRTLSEKSRKRKVDVTEILRFALDDKKSDLSFGLNGINNRMAQSQ